VRAAGIYFKQHPSFAQAWDAPETLKFITGNQKNIYEKIDRFYPFLCGRVEEGRLYLSYTPVFVYLDAISMRLCVNCKP
jgi:hypothetical protein